LRPVDPRLLTHARTTRVFLAASVALGLASALLVVAQAALIAGIVVSVFQHGDDAEGQLWLLVAVSAARALVAWLTELAAHRSSAAVKSELRTRLIDHALTLGPAWLTGRRTGELATLATRGVDALDGYFSRYLPQLALAVAVPAAVLARILAADWISAAVIAVTLPLIPLFAALVGWAAQTHMDRRWRLLNRLSGHFLDVVAGLPTLKVFGRAKAQARNIRAITGDYRRATLRTLRIAFLSWRWAWECASCTVNSTCTPGCWSSYSHRRHICRCARPVPSTTPPPRGSPPPRRSSPYSTKRPRPPAGRPRPTCGPPPSPPTGCGYGTKTAPATLCPPPT
jgi:ATP-binding cassette subfamily C protein CydCD